MRLPKMPKTYTVKEVATILGYSTNSIYTFLKEKRIKGIRVGKGRFRISEPELQRVMNLSKNTGLPTASPVAMPTQSLLATPVASFAHDAAFLARNGEVVEGSFAPPNIFDWFVGLAAMMTGFGLFLFNSVYGAPGFTAISPIIFASRFILIATGLGIILSTMLINSRPWRNVFFLILIILGIVNCTLLLRAGDIDGPILYGSMAAAMMIALLFRTGGIVSMGVYLSFLAILVPIGLFTYPTDSHFVTLASWLSISHTILGVLLSVVSVSFLVLFWGSYVANPLFFAVIVFVSAAIQFAGAIFYGAIGMWSRSFFLIVIGFFTAALPIWRSIQVLCTARQRQLLHMVFVGVGVVLFGIAVVVSLLQQNIWEQQKAEFFNKISAAENTLHSTILSTQSALVVAAANPDFIRGIEKKDQGELARLGKIIYESNPNIQRLVFLDARGDGIALYPYGTFDQPNFAFRDYFQKARDTGKPYVSNIFQSLSDNAKRYVIVVAVPVISAKGEFVGMMTASLDLERLGFELSQLAQQKQGEYFVIVDNQNTILFGGGVSTIGTVIGSDDPIRLGVAGQRDVIQGTLTDGTIGMIAYTPIPDLHWGLSLRVPASRVFGLTAYAVMTIFVSVAVLLISAVILLTFFEAKYCAIPRAGGP